MANLTITVPDEVLYEVRVRAAQKLTSVSRLLRGKLQRYAADDDAAVRGWERFLALAVQHAGRSGDDDRRWTRQSVQRTGSAP